MTTLSNKIQTTCRKLRDNDDDFFNSTDVLACRNISSDFSNVYDKDIQDFIFNSKGYDKDEWEKYKERCRSKVADLKNSYDIENSSVYYNCLIGEDSKTFGESIFGNRRNNFVKLNNEKYNKKKNEFDSLKKKILDSKNRNEENGEEDENNSTPMKRLDNLNNDIEKNIGNLKEIILNDYKDREDLQYDQLIKNFRIIDSNKKIIDKMSDNISYITRKLEIVTEKYNKTKKFFNLVKIFLVLLILVNIGLGAYYFIIIKNKKI
jgi:hypothetical protein